MKLKASIPFILLFGLFSSLYFLSTTAIFNAEIAHLETPILIDVLLTIPILYFLSIRKKKIPKITIIPVIIFGLLLSGFILPETNQTTLSTLKTWLIPVLELGVISYIIYRVVKTIKTYKEIKEEAPDFYTALRGTTHKMMPKKIAALLTMEISVLYFGFINWKKYILKENEFSYHANTGTQTLLYGLLIVIAAETIGIHALLSKWSETAAWIATIISIYSGFQVIGIARSITKRPISIKENTITLNYGIISEATLLFSEIETVEYSKRELEFDATTRGFSPFILSEGHNVIVTMKKPVTIHGFYDIKKQATTIAFYVDDLNRFTNQLDELLPAAHLHT